MGTMSFIKICLFILLVFYAILEHIALAWLAASVTNWTVPTLRGMFAGEPLERNLTGAALVRCTAVLCQHASHCIVFVDSEQGNFCKCVEWLSMSEAEISFFRLNSFVFYFYVYIFLYLTEKSQHGEVCGGFLFVSRCVHHDTYLYCLIT